MVAPLHFAAPTQRWLHALSPPPLCTYTDCLRGRRRGCSGRALSGWPRGLLLPHSPATLGCVADTYSCMVQAMGRWRQSVLGRPWQPLSWAVSGTEAREAHLGLCCRGGVSCRGEARSRGDRKVSIGFGRATGPCPIAHPAGGVSPPRVI